MNIYAYVCTYLQTGMYTYIHVYIDMKIYVHNYTNTRISVNTCLFLLPSLFSFKASTAAYTIIKVEYTIIK